MVGSRGYKGRRNDEPRYHSPRESEMTPMLNLRGKTSFRYGLKEVMAHYKIDDTVALPMIASITAKGSRVSINSAVEFVREQAKAGVCPKEASDEICNLLYRYSKDR